MVYFTLSHHHDIWIPPWYQSACVFEGYSIQLQLGAWFFCKFPLLGYVAAGDIEWCRLLLAMPVRTLTCLPSLPLLSFWVYSQGRDVQVSQQCLLHQFLPTADHEWMWGFFRFHVSPWSCYLHLPGPLSPLSLKQILISVVFLIISLSNQGLHPHLEEELDPTVYPEPF